MKTSTWLLIGAGAYFLLSKPSNAALAPAPAPAPNTGGGYNGSDPSQQILDYGNTLLTGINNSGLINGIFG